MTHPRLICFSTLVSFPFLDLDMSPYTSSSLKGESALYDLRAVCNHFGSLEGGHYTSMGRVGSMMQWAHFNDDNVSACAPRNVLNENVYMLFYERKQRQ